MDQESGAGIAALALVEVRAKDNLFEGGVKISIGKDDLRVLAAQFQAGLLQVLGSATATMRPTPVEPVKVVMCVPGWLDSQPPTSPPP